MKRCPQCGTIVTEGGDTCGVCGRDLSDISDEDLGTAVVDEERIHASDEKVSRMREEKRDLSIRRRKAYVRIVEAVAGATCWILALTIPTRGDTSYVVVVLLLVILGIVFFAYAFRLLLPSRGKCGSF